MKIRMIATVMSLVFLSSCASIIHGSRQTVDFVSQPSGAIVTIDGKEYGETPQSISLRRRGREKGDKSKKKVYNVSIQLDGYYPYEMKIKREVDFWFLGNALIGGVIGIIVDAATGAMYKLTPHQVIAQMHNNATTGMTENKRGDIFISVVMKADPSWEKIGQLNRIE